MSEETITLDLGWLKASSQLAVVIIDQNGIISGWNDQAAEVFGWSADELVGQNYALIFTLADQEAGVPELKLGRAREHGCSDALDWLLRKDGTRLWASSTMLHLENEPLLSFVKLVRDRTTEKVAEEATKTNEARLRLIMETVPQLVWRSRSDGFWDWASPQWTVFTGQSQVDSLGYGWLEMVHSEDRTRTNTSWDVATDQGLEFEVEHRLKRADGDYCWFKTRAVPFREATDKNRTILHWFGTSTDIHAVHEAKEKIVFMAHHDALTGAANRVLLRQELEKELTADGTDGSVLGVFSIDLDRFKECNERIGYQGGDTVLKKMTERLQSVLSSDDLLARVGGDEFVVLRSDNDAQKLEDFGGTLARSVTGPLTVDDHVFHLGASVGLAVNSQCGNNVDESLRRANVALSRAKRDGGNCARQFSISMDRAAHDRSALIVDLDNALETEQLHLHYQPFFSLNTGRLRGFEALARWTHPERGVVSPGVFIPIAESSGRIDRIGLWALGRACMDAQSWDHSYSVAVNLSPAQFHGNNLIGQVTAALERTGLAADLLKLEVTESLLIEDTEAVLRKLQALKSLGVKIALDDFGTGYSSLSYLRRFPFDKVKIDQSFVQNMHDQASRAIVSAVISLGHSIGLTVTAEGIETREQLKQLCMLGCDEAQGYLLGRPSDEAAVNVCTIGLPSEPGDELKSEVDLQVLRPHGLEQSHVGNSKASAC